MAKNNTNIGLALGVALDAVTGVALHHIAVGIGVE